MKDICDFKVLSINNDNLCVCNGYTFYNYHTATGIKVYSGEIKNDKYSKYAKYSLSRRLLRAEITGFYNIEDKHHIAVAKKGIFVKTIRGDYKCTWRMQRGSKPLNLCFYPNGHIYWGEYFQNMGRVAVHIMGSFDNGATWKKVYSFAEGNINHIHGLFYDKYTDRIWVLTGDRENECIIGYTEDEFKSFHELFRGGQEYRSCLLFFYSDFIVFATDSQYIHNEIRYIDRKTLEVKVLTKIQGSAIKGGQSGEVSYLSTTVEPSKVNKEQYAHIWITKDGLHWKDVYKAKKDWWPSIFQFGTFEFPQYFTPIKDKLYFSGRALKGHDGKTKYIKM